MKAQLFTISTNKNQLEIDQNSLNDFLETIEVIKTDTAFLEEENCWSVLVLFEEKSSKIETKTATKLDVEVELSAYDTQIYNHLKTWRSEKAEQLGWKNFMICHNSHLLEIAVNKPNSIDELKQIKGFGSAKTNQFGDDIISLLNAV